MIIFLFALGVFIGGVLLLTLAQNNEKKDFEKKKQIVTDYEQKKYGKLITRL